MQLLDLYCGAGGAATGYARAGFEVTGVDIALQPNYPYSFIQDNAVDFVRRHGGDYDVIHASPPCQAYSIAAKRWPAVRADLVAATRDALIQTNKPYIIENVIGAPLINWIELCGEMFGLRLIRHRRFESNLPLKAPLHIKHRGMIKDGYYLTLAGHGGDSRDCRLETWRKVMEMPWATKKEMVEAVPPAYTQYIGKQLRYLLMKKMELRAELGVPLKFC